MALMSVLWRADASNGWSVLWYKIIMIRSVEMYLINKVCVLLMRQWKNVCDLLRIERKYSIVSYSEARCNLNDLRTLDFIYWFSV